MSLNKVITSVNALVNNVSIPIDELNNVVCIDVENNRIGVKNGSPEYEIDISGTLNTNFINIDNTANPTDSFDVSYEKMFLRFSRGLELTNDLSCDAINTNNLSCDAIYTNDLSCNNIYAKQIISDISFTQKLSVIGDLSVNGVLFTPDGEVNISDDRYKHNEKIITNGLEIIRKLQPQTYDKTRTFKDIDFQGVVNEAHIKEAGLIAQELYDINDLSFAVIPGNDTEPYGVRYNNVFIFGLAAVKELDTIVSNLSEKVSNISNEPHDISNTNLSNILDFVKNQNKLIQTLNEKITNLEKRII